MHRLFHISENDSITRFEPRPPPSPDAGVLEPSVWAVDEKLIHNYLLPRDCPRVTYYALPDSKPEDIERLIGPGQAKHIVAIESAWFERAQRKTIWIYEFDPAPFSVTDSGAGYYIAKVAISPIGQRRVENPLRELISLGVELRVVPSLWPLRDAVVSSTLQFSCIRMRNAQPRLEKSNQAGAPLQRE